LELMIGNVVLFEVDAVMYDRMSVISQAEKLVPYGELVLLNE
jgi:hypothetical protein